MTIDDKCRKLIGKTYTLKQLETQYGQPQMELNGMKYYSMKIKEGKIKLVMTRQDDGRYKTIDSYFNRGE